MTKIALFFATIAIAAYGCGGDATDYNPPSDHTVSQDGVMHRPGLEAPLTNCVSCHGANLEGGQGPSCTTCHGQKW